MNNFFANLFDLLINPPGNLVYYLLLIISIVGALQGVISVGRSGASLSVKRPITGLVILLLLQIVPYLVSPFAWSGNSSLGPQYWMAPVDRALSLLGLIWIAWLWIFPKPAPKADIATVILSLMTIVLFGTSLVFWSQAPNAVFYNNTFQDNTWQITTLAFIALALIILLIRRPPGYGYGLATLFLAGSGHLIHFVTPVYSGYFSGIIRFTQMAMYPLLLALPQFIAESSSIETRTVSADASKGHFRERRRYSTDPKTFTSMFTLAAESETDKVGPNITRSIAQSMLADLVFLILIDQDKKLNIACGYDLIREEVMDGNVINKEMIPTLSNAILRGRPLRLVASEHAEEFTGLGQLVGLSNPGNAMTIPIESSKRGSTIGAILLLSPYSDRVWNADDQTFLVNISTLIVPIMARSQNLTGLIKEREAALNHIAELEEKLQLQESNLQASQEIDENESISKNLAEISAALEEARIEIARLTDENKVLSTAPSESGSKENEVEQKFRMTLEELANLQNELTEANSRINDLELSLESSTPQSSTHAFSQLSATPIPLEQAVVLGSISRELRQPISSIAGYVDLLLGESVGILGALQRKFLEHIKESTEKISKLVEDLVENTPVEMNLFPTDSDRIDINLIIDNAVAYTSNQLREKNITMRLDIPESPPKININREALQQILIHLLQNAGAATKVEGTVMLKVKFHEENGENFLMIQVVDSGGGIPAEDLPRVFVDRHQDENSLIQGLGDEGVGLSIAKSMTEEQSGRIWVETKRGIGSTISALLPYESVEEAG